MLLSFCLSSQFTNLMSEKKQKIRFVIDAIWLFTWDSQCFSFALSQIQIKSQAVCSAIFQLRSRVFADTFGLCRFREQFTNFASLLRRHRHMYQLFVHTTRARCTHMNEWSTLPALTTHLHKWWIILFESTCVWVAFLVALSVALIFIFNKCFLQWAKDVRFMSDTSIPN